MKAPLILYGGEEPVDDGEVVPLLVKTVDSDDCAALRELADYVNLHATNGRRAVVVEVVEEEIGGYWDTEGWEAWRQWQRETGQAEREARS